MQTHQNSSDPVATIGIDTGKNTSDRLVAGQARLRMADAGEDGVDAVAVPAFEEVAPEPSVLLHVADHRLDGRSGA